MHADYAEADSAYQLASIAMANENAAELAKAKEAERAALLEQRAEREIQRGEELEAIVDFQKGKVDDKETAQKRLETLKENLSFESDEDKKNEILNELYDKKV